MLHSALFNGEQMGSATIYTYLELLKWERSITLFYRKRNFLFLFDKL